MKGPSGFTLIELMIVITIIAILGSIAITAYSKSIRKAQLSEAFTAVDSLQVNLVQYYHQTGQCPNIGDPTSGLANSPTSYSGRYVARADVSNSAGGCTITATMKNTDVAIPLRGKKVKFTITFSNTGSAQWICSSDIVPAYLPQTCR